MVDMDDCKVTSWNNEDGKTKKTGTSLNPFLSNVRDR